ncbi:hypothetical protein GOP47_0003096 [Adiantum capillus-veneris]|uniref:RWP-RK domain-containing protein n=1 Tax=Adiantum capillus-veneris TaxID=13818 RepID=A0A9D4VBT1_ADICA|nr:hypothetical protein GOP47_0003096 [Adiantum capillus-veneris]
MSSEYVPHSRSTQQQPVTAQVDLSFDEVANHFPFPIAEAASNLGVSTNDLKRVCRENGLNRWPYRKILAGKTVEDVKKEAAREMAILERMSRLQPQSASNTLNALRSNRSGAYTIATSSAGSVLTEKDRPTIDLLKRQTAGPALGLYAHASTLKPLHIDQRSQLHNQFHLRVNIPTYLDDFKQGFPSKGLSSVTTEWWGNVLSDETDDPPSVKETEHTVVEPSPEGQSNEDQHTSSLGFSSQTAETSTTDLTPASILTRTRKNAVETGRKALGILVARGYGAHRLADKDETLLRAIFADNFPVLWEAYSVTNQHG